MSDENSEIDEQDLFTFRNLREFARRVSETKRCCRIYSENLNGRYIHTCIDDPVVYLVVSLMLRGPDQTPLDLTLHRIRVVDPRL